MKFHLPVRFCSLSRTRRMRGGFTLIEVLVAAFILTLVASGAVWTAWRLTGFAKEEVEKMVASSYCSDVYLRLARTDPEALAKEFRDYDVDKTYRIPEMTLASVTDAQGVKECILMRNSWAHEEPQLTITRIRPPADADAYGAGMAANSSGLYYFKVKIEWQKFVGDADYRRSLAITNAVSVSIDNRADELTTEKGGD